MKNFRAVILVVEDNEDDQFFIKRAFDKAGFGNPVQVVSGGDEAVAYMKGEGKYADRTKFAYPTFIMTDLNMPRGNGFDVLRHLKANPDWQAIPAVMFSSSTDPFDIRTAYSIGASSYHLKPNGIEEMNAQIAVLRSYWATCELPQVTENSGKTPTDNSGELEGGFRTRNILG